MQTPDRRLVTEAALETTETALVAAIGDTADETYAAAEVRAGDLDSTRALRATAQSLAGRLSTSRFSSWVSPDSPSFLTFGTTQYMTSGPYHDISTMTTHPGASHDTTYGRLTSMSPLEFILDGSEFELTLIAINGYGGVTDIWVDDQPVRAEPRSATLPTNTTGYLCLKWDTPAVRRIKITNFGAHLRFLRTPDLSHQVYPVNDKPAVGILTDSFGGQTNYCTNFESFPYQIEKRLNVNLVKSVGGGSGYIPGGSANKPYGHADRRTHLRSGGPLDAVVFFGSVNDPGTNDEALLRGAYRAVWDAYAEDHPRAPLVVLGTQPSGGANATDLSVHRRNRWMYLEAQAHPRVIGFIDQLGTARTGTVPPAWSASVNYVAGDLVTHLGATYECMAPTLAGNYNPDASKIHWRRVSWVFTGTGNSGGTKGDGNRDFLLGGDGVHPTTKGSQAFAQLIAGALVKVLGDDAPFTYFNV